jgi:ACS family sodium-dependent inorganic phosphate cotransporter
VDGIPLMFDRHDHAQALACTLWQVYACLTLLPPVLRSAFYVGYTITNLVGGYLASSLSAKQVLGWGVVLWSIFTITTPPAAAASLPVLLGNRAVMGAGEGVTFPCVQNIVKGWVPADTRTRALTLIYSGGQLGTIVALITAPLIIKVS